MVSAPSNLSFSDVAFCGANYACSAVTYGATVFSVIKAGVQVAAFPHLVLIGLVAGLGCDF